ncbi:hypothetical protein IFM89_023706 [Coptis chinensis]|uniref:F-box domain-containing protein n=1 Tax=Coptis chinensis TaxID=261450 RepID=A0A835M4P3_9MAGN|nr:hypothetical protein IFM89_023706 [Coptis chinensis]
MEKQETIPSKNKRRKCKVLPDDVLMDIFSRLPLKTLSNSKWVCKNWYVLVRHPLLAQLHFARNPLLPCPLFHSQHQDRESYLIDPEHFVNHENSATAYHLQLKDVKNFFGTRYLEVVGTVNGLVCFSPYRYAYQPLPYYICNPITRDYLIPPTSPMVDYRPLGNGFGFDSLHNEYKVIRILRESCWKTTGDMAAEVFTLGSDSWREITTNVPFINFMEPCNVLVNGCLHWVAYVGNHVGKRAILSFNVETEQFDVIQMPTKEGSYSDSYDLMVLGGHLCVMINNGLGNREIQVMKDYGVHSSWAKKFVLEPKAVNLFFSWGQMIELKNGEILFISNSGELGYYYHQTKIFSIVKIFIIKGGPVKADLSSPIFLTGSLFSPNNVGYYRRAEDKPFLTHRAIFSWNFTWSVTKGDITFAAFANQLKLLIFFFNVTCI